MESLAKDIGRIKPVSTWAYIDSLQVRLKQPVSAATCEQLRKHCGHVYLEYNPARFDFTYRWRLDVKQPAEQAFEWIATRADALINRADFAIDWCLHSSDEQAELQQLIETHKARRWHSEKHGVRYYPGKAQTVYDAPRWAKTVLAIYRDPVSRISGELFTYRIEWRSSGVRALRTCGITTPQDLLNFDHRKFWQRRLVLFTVEKEKLGRYVANRTKRGKRRTAEMSKGVNLDKRRGHVLLSSVRCMQELIDRYRRPFRIVRPLQRIDVTNLLPDSPNPSGIVGLVTTTTTEDRRSHEGV